MMSILETCLSSPVGDHYGGTRTTHKILQYGYCWPTINKDAHYYFRDVTSAKRKEIFCKNMSFL